MPRPWQNPAYEQTATAPLIVLAQRRPPQQVVERHILLIRQTVHDHAEQVLKDPAFDALTAVLADAEKAGHDPKQLLQQAADQRALADARRPAQVLTWRIERLGQRHAPGPQAATARSTTQRPAAAAPASTPTPAPQPPPARRR
ncbi:hypothetical protein [Streptomyces sp. HUAS TT7]|uniref:hypothetical protein n=1 Tax=Streptomyces sp. HUAS TT7 TaxID=3447507 RepID=UPI003F656E76